MNAVSPPQGPGSRLGLLTPRDTKAAAAHSAAYSRFVAAMRKLLPLIVLLILGALVLWPEWVQRNFGMNPVPSIPNLMVEKLNLTGVDAGGRAYSLTADRALQAGGLKDIIKLERPEGELALGEGAWLMGRARQGELDQASRRVFLSGEVELFHNQGYRFLTDAMQVDLTQSAAWGDKDVLFQGSFGDIRGKGFRLEKEGDIVHIQGPATAKLRLRALQGSDKPSLTPPPKR